jgi:hypothetical protein
MKTQKTVISVITTAKSQFSVHGIFMLNRMVTYASDFHGIDHSFFCVWDMTAVCHVQCTV